MDNQDQDKEIQNLKNLSKCQTLVIVALIGGPVSLLIGGLPLSTASIICAVIAFVSLKKADAKDKPEGSLERRLYIQAMAALAICIIATILNAYFFIDTFTKVLEAYNSGNLDSYLNSMMYGQGESPGSSKSVWDR